MSKQSMGKTLLRNVIRHTDAHNKIQEETEMWKMRGWQKNVSDTESARGRMHCDRDQPREFSRSRDRASEHDDREAKYWTRKLYEFEAKDPDRWGHSGFKELYPEEFESNKEKHSSTKKLARHKLKKSKSDTEASLSKRSKKSSHKKKKKKREEGERRKKVDCSSSSSDESSPTKDKERRKRTKSSRHKNKKASKSRGRDEDSSSGDSGDEQERLTHSHRKRKRDSDSGLHSKKKCRSSDQSCAD